ncbi:MAG: hypothetical protein ABUT20_14205 [Bacteroidota bacterium]
MEEIKTSKPKQTSGLKRFFRVFIIVLILTAVGYFFWKYYFVFGEGTKAGQLNFFVKKGYLFKTYEGRIIQTGYKSNVPGSIQSNEFDFSVIDEKVANVLMSNSGAVLELHYKEYLGAPPWRGMSQYIVDSIISVHRTIDNPNTVP